MRRTSKSLTHAPAADGDIAAADSDVPVAEPVESTDAAPDQPFESAAPDDEPADEPPFVAEDDDRSWEDYVRTDADVEADRFFAAFDAEGDSEAPTPGDPHPDTPSPADVHDRAENEGDEQR